MGYYRDPGGTFFYTSVGSNTLIQVSNTSIVLFDCDITINGGSAGYLQFYLAGSQTASGSAGTPDFIYAVSPHSQQGTVGWRDLDFPIGRQCNKGLSILWSPNGTGTVAHGNNAIVNMTYVGTGI